MSTGAKNPAAGANELSEDDIQRMRFRKALARKRRKEREAAGEIKELNITAMMDMMTIILVFLLKSYASSSVTMASSDEVRLPLSTTRLTPKDTVSVTITPRQVLVGEKPRAVIENGKFRAGDLNGRTVLPLDDAFRKEVEKLKKIEERGGAKFSRELTVVGDRRTPYDILMTVLYTAGQNELENFRFIVVKKDE